MTEIMQGGETILSLPPGGDNRFKGVSVRRQERAFRALEMFEEGMKTSEIAQVLGISQRLVQMDLQVAKRLQWQAFQKMDQSEILGGEIAFWRHLCRTAMRDYSLSQVEACKIGFLRVAMEARAKLTKLLQDTGLLDKVPERLTIEEGLDFSDPEIRAGWLALMIKTRENKEKDRELRLLPGGE